MSYQKTGLFSAEDLRVVPRRRWFAPWRKVRTTQRRYAEKSHPIAGTMTGRFNTRENVQNVGERITATECRESMENQPAYIGSAKPWEHAENPSCGCPVGPDGAMGEPGLDESVDRSEATKLPPYQAITLNQTDEPNK